MGGIGPGHAARRAATKARAEEMAVLYRSGLTLQEIGEAYGITRERVRQLISFECGVTAEDGGRAVKVARQRAERRRRREARCIERRGCSLAQYATIPPQAREAFLKQRLNARHRGIGWELTVWQWWTIWQQSGHWNERGRGTGCYVMCRHGDHGPYKVGNVFIELSTVNVSQRSNRKTDLPMGVKKAGQKFVALRQINGRRLHLGTYRTPMQAHAAYLAAEVRA